MVFIGLIFAVAFKLPNYYRERSFVFTNHLQTRVIREGDFFYTIKPSGDWSSTKAAAFVSPFVTSAVIIGMTGNDKYLFVVTSRIKKLY